MSLHASAALPLVLDHNLRNTRQIANAFQPLVDHPMRFLGGGGLAQSAGQINWVVLRSA